jgi:hypothetical protein
MDSAGLVLIHSILGAKQMSYAKRLLVGANGFQPSIQIVPNVANAGGSAGADVTTSLATSFQDQYGNGFLPPDYAVIVTANQDAMTSVINKTPSGFSVVLTPKTASATIAAGTFDLVILGNT